MELGHGEKAETIEIRRAMCRQWLSGVLDEWSHGFNRNEHWLEQNNTHLFTSGCVIGSWHLVHEYLQIEVDMLKHCEQYASIDRHVHKLPFPYSTAERGEVSTTIRFDCHARDVDKLLICIKRYWKGVLHTAYTTTSEGLVKTE